MHLPSQDAGRVVEPAWQDVERVAAAIHRVLARAGHVPRRVEPRVELVPDFHDLPLEWQADFRLAARAALDATAGDHVMLAQ